MAIVDFLECKNRDSPRGMFFLSSSLQLRLMRFWVQGDTETKKSQSSFLRKLSFRIWWDSKGIKHVKSALKENSAKQM